VQLQPRKWRSTLSTWRLKSMYNTVAGLAPQAGCGVVGGSRSARLGTEGVFVPILFVCTSFSSGGERRGICKERDDMNVHNAGIWGLSRKHLEKTKETSTDRNIYRHKKRKRAFKTTFIPFLLVLLRSLRYGNSASNSTVGKDIYSFPDIYIDSYMCA
jgi:hypothetical protein